MEGMAGYYWLSLALWVSPTLAQEFYKGKTIRFIVATTPGGGFDAYSRAIARHMPRHIPGNPAIIVENMPGAGFLIGTNYLYTQAKPDGLTIGNWIGTLVLHQLLGRKGVEFDARRFEYVGGMLQRFVFQLWGAKGINSLAELKGKTVAVTTPRTSTEIAARETLKKTGVISDKDVGFIYVQTIPAILTLLLSGKTSAGTLSAPNTLKARDAGLNFLADIAKLNIPGLHVAYGTNERFLKSNPNSVYAFLKVIAEATVASRQNPSLAKKAIANLDPTKKVVYWLP